MGMDKGEIGRFPKPALKLCTQHSFCPPARRPTYAIYTNTSKLVVSSILTQESDYGENLVVSTASRVLTPTERRYSTCEQELLVVVHVLQKLRIYVIGHAAIVYSDNKALSFLRSCNLISSRVTRWII
jgi:hypothetical protein